MRVSRKVASPPEHIRRTARYISLGIRVDDPMSHAPRGGEWEVYESFGRVKAANFRIYPDKNSPHPNMDEATVSGYDFWTDDQRSQFKFTLVRMAEAMREQLAVNSQQQVQN